MLYIYKENYVISLRDEAVLAVTKHCVYIRYLHISVAMGFIYKTGKWNGEWRTPRTEYPARSQITRLGSKSQKLTD